MRKLMWLLPAVALWIAPPAAQAQFGRPYGPQLGPHYPGVPGAGDPFGQPSGIPGVPGLGDPFGPLTGVPGIPGGYDPIIRRRGHYPFIGPGVPLPGVPGLGRPGSNNPWLDLDPGTPRPGLPGRDFGPITPRPGAPNLGNLPPVKFVTPPVNPPPLDVGALLGHGSSGFKGPPPAESDSHSFDPRWWPWVLGGAAVVFMVSLIAGYASGRCSA